MTKFVYAIFIVFIITVSLSTAQIFSPSSAYFLAMPYSSYGPYPYNPAHQASVTGGIGANLFCLLVLHKLSDHGRCPDKLIIFRNGCCEGQFKRVLSKVTVVVPNRMHNLRFMLDNANPQMRPPEQNVKPGKIVDTVVVHPSYNEFYLNPHVALQGTAKTPRFA